MSKIESKLQELEQKNNATIQPDKLQAKLIQALREAVGCLDNMKRARERDQSGAPRLSLIDVSALADNTLTRIEALLTEGK